MRVFLFLTIYFIGLVLTLKKPFYGVMIFVALFYLSPTYTWWGDIVHHQIGIRTSLIISIVTLISFIIHHESFAKANRNINNKPLIWLLALIFIMFLSSSWAVISSEIARKDAIEISKRVLFFFLMTRVINTDKELRSFIWLNLFGCSYFGWQAFSGDYMHGGRLEGVGGPTIRESEGLAAHLCIFLPYSGLYFLNGNKREKSAIFLITPFIINALILTRTRASFLSLIPMVLYFLLFCDKKYRTKYTFLLFLGLFAFIWLADPYFWTVMGTIKSYEQEGSAVTRILIWQNALKMMFDYPMGIGGGNFVPFSKMYIEELPTGRAAHNSFLKIGTENGWAGLMIFLGFWFSALKIFWRNKKYTALDEEDKRRKVDIFGMEIGFIGFFVASCFVNRIFTDSLYWMVATGVIGDKLWKIKQKTIGTTLEGVAA